jgi:hypothetical protein
MNSLKKRFFIWSVIPALLCVMALWYPFGFSLSAMLDEWGFYNFFNHTPSYWNSFPGNPLSDMWRSGRCSLRHS